MRIARLRALSLLMVGCAVLLNAQAAAQDKAKAQFKAPKRIQAGDAFLGEGRLYPSPVLHDVDGDGLRDIVVGDLFGKVTFAPQIPGEEVRFGPEKPLKGRDGKPLKFHNW